MSDELIKAFTDKMTSALEKQFTESFGMKEGQNVFAYVGELKNEIRELELALDEALNPNEPR